MHDLIHNVSVAVHSSLLFLLPILLFGGKKRFLFGMTSFDSKALLRAIDEELDRLRKVRDLLTSDGDLQSRPVKRTLSAEARQRIVDAQKRRWAARKLRA